jgi:hypothetical protein
VSNISSNEMATSMAQHFRWLASGQNQAMSNISSNEMATSMVQHFRWLASGQNQTMSDITKVLQPGLA